MTRTYIEHSLTVACVLAIICWILMVAAFGKEGDNHGNHGELKGWFDGLRSKRGMCCSFADGQTVEDVDWDTQDGHYRVRLNGSWVKVPDEAVIEEPNRFGPAVVWPYTTEYGVEIRCFMPGALT